MFVKTWAINIVKPFLIVLKNLQHKSLADKIDDKLGEYGRDFMKIKFNSNNNLLLNKILKLHMLTEIFRSVFQEDSKYYLQVF